MSDLISRQEAIDAIRDMQAFEDDNGQPYLYLYDVMAVFTDEEELPPIQPAEPKRGKWILDRSGAYCCSECMEPCAGYVMMKPRDKYCKMCGAKMEVNNESN